MAWSIYHSVRLVLRSGQQALKLSSPVIALTLLSFAIFITALVVAVAWHRFVLLEEETNTPFHAFHGS